jgi:putative ABC transport system ATP-binding protein
VLNDTPTFKPGADQPVLQARGLTKGFSESVNKPVLFEGLSFELAAGQSVALLGESGCGKSTLLNLIAGLEPIDSGEVSVLGQPMLAGDADTAALLRRQHIGFVFQAFHLLPQLDCINNVMVPLLLQQRGLNEARELALSALRRVGLEHQATAPVSRLSGGEQQRAALARAIVHSPALILADEPTGNLDAHHAAQVMSLLIDLTRDHGCALLMVTHSESAASSCDYRWHLRGGRLHVAPEATRV